MIAVLAGLLLPSLSKGRQRARRLVCLNNLRQFAVADLLYLDENRQLPALDSLIPSSLSLDRLKLLSKGLGMPLPPGALITWPKRASQPTWFNCPMAADSGMAEGLTLGGGIYTGYDYVAGLEESLMVSNHFATVVNPGHAADLKNSRRGALWSDVLNEFLVSEPRRFEFFHHRTKVAYPDFRFHAEELDGFHRAWSDGSVEWVTGSRIRLTGPDSPDLRLAHIFGNSYF